MSRFTSINNFKYETINPKSEFNQIHSEFYHKHDNFILADDREFYSENLFLKLCDELKIQKKKLYVFIKRMISFMTDHYLEVLKYKL